MKPLHVCELASSTMIAQRQARKKFLKRLIDLDLGISELARQVGHPRESVSKAIHHGRFPRILKKVREAIDV